GPVDSQGQFQHSFPHRGGQARQQGQGPKCESADLVTREAGGPLAFLLALARRVHALAARAQEHVIQVGVVSHGLSPCRFRSCSSEPDSYRLTCLASPTLRLDGLVPAPPRFEPAEIVKEPASEATLRV